MKLKKKILCVQDGKACTKDDPRLACVSAGEFCPESPSKSRSGKFHYGKSRRFLGRRQKMAIAARVVLKFQFADTVLSEVSPRPTCATRWSARSSLLPNLVGSSTHHALGHCRCFQPTSADARRSERAQGRPFSNLRRPRARR